MGKKEHLHSWPWWIIGKGNLPDLQNQAGTKTPNFQAEEIPNHPSVLYKENLSPSGDHLPIILERTSTCSTVNMNRMLIPLIAACVLVSMTMGNLVRAPAPTTSDDCGCQCDGTTFLDEDHTVQGNCRAADSSGRKWCFITPDHTADACGDAFGYDSRYNLFKSYAACSSPDPSSLECQFTHE